MDHSSQNSNEAMSEELGEDNDELQVGPLNIHYYTLFAISSVKEILISM